MDIADRGELLPGLGPVELRGAAAGGREHGGRLGAARPRLPAGRLERGREEVQEVHPVLQPRAQRVDGGRRAARGHRGRFVLRPGHAQPRDPGVAPARCPRCRSASEPGEPRGERAAGAATRELGRGKGKYQHLLRGQPFQIHRGTRLGGLQLLVGHHLPLCRFFFFFFSLKQKTRPEPRETKAVDFSGHWVAGRTRGARFIAASFLN